MKPDFKTRMKQWLCKVFGHRTEFSHHFNNKDFYVCRRCGRFVEEDK